MRIQTEEEMVTFCKNVRGPFEVRIQDDLTDRDAANFEFINQEMIQKKKISKDSHLQQGIKTINYDETGIVVNEIPRLYPSIRILVEDPYLTGPMTGNLSNCYDPLNKLSLFQMRGRDISSPYGFQAAAAGMGYFRGHPKETARREFIEESGINYPKVLFHGRAVDILPFMKGEKIPQPLFSFGFAYELSKFPICHDLNEIEAFGAKIKKEISEEKIEQKEGYHFTIPLFNLERSVGELNDRKRFYGPIYESTINFLRALKDNSIL